MRRGTSTALRRGTAAMRVTPATATAMHTAGVQRRLASSTGPRPLSEVDPEVYQLIQEEYERQKYGIELIASEVTHQPSHLLF